LNPQVVATKPINVCGDVSRTHLPGAIFLVLEQWPGGQKPNSLHFFREVDVSDVFGQSWRNTA
jgi:hypothetical protein